MQTKTEKQISNANRIWEIKIEMSRMSTIVRSITPNKMSVLIAVPKATAAIKNCRITSTIFFESGTEVEMIIGKANNGILIRMSLLA